LNGLEGAGLEAVNSYQINGAGLSGLHTGFVTIPRFMGIPQEVLYKDLQV
jgi:hypothetical protein